MDIKQLLEFAGIDTSKPQHQKLFEDHMSREQMMQIIFNGIGDWETDSLFSFIENLLVDLSDIQLNQIIVDNEFM